MVLHGTPAGYARGCRSRGGCQHHGSPDFLTCVDAHIARQADFRLSRLPTTVQVRRVVFQAAASLTPTAPTDEAGPAVTSPVHGTVWGYRRGCRGHRECPRWRTGLPTCVEAKRLYATEYARNRERGHGTPIAHGTTAGYFAGCRDRGACAGDASGVTCADARNTHKRAEARRAGTPERENPVDAADAATRIAAWRAQGYSLRTIARLSGVGRSTVTAIAGNADARTSRSKITSATLSAILALGMPDSESRPSSADREGSTNGR